MARIEEKEFEDIDGSIKKIRIIEADRIVIERSDGSREELEDLPANFRAQEDPWTGSGQAIRWELFNFPFGPFEINFMFRPNEENIPKFVTLFAVNGEILLRLGAIAIEMLRSADSEVLLVGEEIPP